MSIKIYIQKLELIVRLCSCLNTAWSKAQFVTIKDTYGSSKSNGVGSMSYKE